MNFLTYMKSQSIYEYLVNGVSLHAQALADLIWQLYRETKFYDFVGGMPGGKQRQANLRALYDRLANTNQVHSEGYSAF